MDESHHDSVLGLGVILLGKSGFGRLFRANGNLKN